MLTRRVIPCLDVKGGRVVKGLRFENIQDAGDPVQLAAMYGSGGADELVFLDITASAERRQAIPDMVRRVARTLDIPFTVGGGVATMADARNILLNGADKAATNTGAVEDPSLITHMKDVFGRQCVVVAIDAKRAGAGYEVYTYGGTKATGIDAVWWAQEAVRRGAGEILLTSMDMDGTGMGYDVGLTGMVSEAVSVPVIASGGCGSAQHMADVLEQTAAGAALAASIFHYKRRAIQDVKEFLAGRGIPVRL